jgi:signal transduction histidine kinase/ligand-binding sensor domain-containing protein
LLTDTASIAAIGRVRVLRILLLLLCALSTVSLHATQPPMQRGQPDRIHVAEGEPLFDPPPPPAFAETSHISWTRRDGVPGSITSLAQTKDGYLWIGTNLGLYRFDGLKFTAYPSGSNNRPLPSLYIASLSSDLDGGLWIAFQDTAMMHLLADGTTTVYRASDGLDANMLEQVIARPDGSVWAFGGSKLFKLEGKRWIDFGKAHGLAGGGVFSLFFDREGTIWIGRDKMLWSMKAGEPKFTPYPTIVHYVNSMAQARDGRLWLADAWRMVRALSDTSEKGTVGLHGKAVVLLDSNDNLWVAQSEDGLLRIPHLSDQTIPTVVERAGSGDLTAPRVHALLEDREGNIWVGTDRGLDRYRVTPFVHFRDTELREFPSMVAAEDGSVWLNTHDSPLMHITNGKTAFVGNHLNSGPLAKRANGDICFVELDATVQELQCYGGKGMTRAPLSPDLHHAPPMNMVEDADGSLLISFFNKHLWRYSSQGWEPVAGKGLPKKDPWGMFLDSQKQLWLGFRSDQIVERKDGAYVTFPIEGGDWSNSLTFFEGAGTMWAGGSDGLVFLHEGRFRRVHAFEKDLLRGISGVVLDKFGNLWLNAGAGALRISANEIGQLLRDPDHIIKIEIFDENDGLVGQPTQFTRTPSAIVDGRGQLWFATGGDLTTLDPGRLRESRMLPAVQIENVLVDGKPALDAPGVSGAVLKISANHLHDLEISYIGICLSAPERVFYRYRLIEEDSQWQDVGSRRQAFYTRLRPGTYHFEVAASNGEDWSTLAVPLTLEVTPAFYQTWQFEAICAAVVVGLVWFCFWARVRYATEHFRSLLSERLAERERIARDLHDTLLQGFQGLILRFHLATQLIPTTQEARREMEEALDCADEVLGQSRDKIRGLRYEGTAETSIPQALSTLTKELTLRYKPSFETVTKGDPVRADPVSYEDIFAVAKEALTNASRHSGASLVRTEVSFTHKSLSLRISDNGRGIDPDVLTSKKRANHYGLAGMYERAVNLRADLKITSPSEGGTEVLLIVPAIVAYRQDGKRPLSRFIYRHFGFGVSSGRSPKDSNSYR